MKVVFSRPASRDLDDIQAHLAPLSPPGLANVIGALRRRIAILSDHPAIGRPTNRPTVREMVEPRYGYLIVYRVDPDAIRILRIYRAVRAPLDPDTLERP